VETIEREESAIEVAAFNIGGNVRFPIRETTARVDFTVWEMCAFAGFLMGREAAKVMLPRGRGTILFTGATASVRGGTGFAAFAGGKHSLRALSQSMVRELGPLDPRRPCGDRRCHRHAAATTPSGSGGSVRARQPKIQ
jgi:NAD(P)-dependent dehydrogenase (short-subunit alcohol dehydrogenase family)